jgi:manganese-dependent inorganic pyrophosphatase
MQGEINPETAFILEKFGFEAPLLKTSYANEEVFITDTTDLALCPDDILDAKVVGVVDHHKLGDLTTSTPLEAWIRPVGCSNTIVKEMFDYHKIEIPKDIAGIMMCAILSDTVIFKSPTCTKEDTKAVKELATIAGIENPKELGMEMFKVKSKVEGTPIRELVLRDFKDFNMSGTKVGIGQLEVIDVAIFDDIKDDLLKDIQSLKKEGDRHSVLLLLTDIMKEGSELLIASNEISKIEAVYREVDVMITHTFPLSDANILRLAGDKDWDKPYRAFYTFNGSKYMQNGTMKYWICGHIHYPLDYEYAGVSILCNPLGYLESNRKKGYEPTMKSFEIAV